MNYFLEKYKFLTGGKIKYFNSETIKLFIDNPWYGNVRELETMVQKAIIYSEDDEIKKENILLLFLNQTYDYKNTVNINLAAVKQKSLEDIEKYAIIQAMKESDRKMRKACKILGITYRTLQYRLGKYGIKAEKNTPNGA